MCDRTIVTKDKSNRLKDLTKRYQDTASTIGMTSKRMSIVSLSSFTHNILGG